MEVSITLSEEAVEKLIPLLLFDPDKDKRIEDLKEQLFVARGDKERR